MTAVDGALASDLAVTWLGAIGTALYLRHSITRPDSMRDARPTSFLFGVLTVLLAVRGFFWIWDSAWLGRIVFAAATLLPLAMTVFTEHLLRRHHPAWLKLLALASTVVFAIVNLVLPLASSGGLLLAFMLCLVLTLAGNAWFLLRATEADLGSSERQLVRLVVGAATVSILLAVTDFRGELPRIPLRLGALGPLALTCVLLTQSQFPGIAHVLARAGVAMLFAAALAAAFALATHGPGAAFAAAMTRCFPVALAWILLTVIVVRLRSLSAADAGNRFLDWLLHAPLDSASAFVTALRDFDQARELRVLEAADLEAYALDRWFEREPAGLYSLVDARAQVRGGDPAQLDAAEQMLDLLERHEMTHAMLVSRAPPLVVLLTLPQGAGAASGERRAAVVQRLARRLASLAPVHA